MTFENPQPVRGPRPVRSAIVLAATIAVVVTAAVATGASPSPQTANPQATVSPDSTAAPGSTPSTGKNPGSMPMDPGGFMARPGWMSPRGFRGGFPGGFFGAPNAITIDSIDGANLHLKTDDGWTRTIDTTGVTITRAGTTVTAADLGVGDNVLIKEQRNSDGTFTVTALQIVLPHVDGVVDSVTSDGFTVKLGDGTTKTVSVDSTTTYTLGKNAATKADLTSGLQVDVEGTASGDTFTASAVRIAPSVLAGTVTATTDSSITITERDGSSGTITVDSNTTWTVAGVDNPTIADVKVGDIVIAEGSLGTDGTLAATDVQAGTHTIREGGPGPGGFGRFGPGRGPGFGGFGRGSGGGQGPGENPGQNPNQPSPSPDGSSDSGTNG